MTSESSQEMFHHRACFRNRGLSWSLNLDLSFCNAAGKKERDWLRIQICLYDDPGKAKDVDEARRQRRAQALNPRRLYCRSLAAHKNS